MLEKVSWNHETYLLDPQLFCWRPFSKTEVQEVVQNTDLKILALYAYDVAMKLNKHFPALDKWLISTQ